jgi:hypothetical protein
LAFTWFLVDVTEIWTLRNTPRLDLKPILYLLMRSKKIMVKMLEIIDVLVNFKFSPLGRNWPKAVGPPGFSKTSIRTRIFGFCDEREFMSNFQINFIWSGPKVVLPGIIWSN